MDLRAAGRKVADWFRHLGAFTAGMMLGTCYGAVIATLTSYFLLGG